MIEHAYTAADFAPAAIVFCTGERARSSGAHPRTVPTFEAFCDFVLTHGADCKEKDGPWVCAPLDFKTPNKRKGAQEQPWRVLILDIDDCTEEKQAAAYALLNSFRGFAYPTFSDGKPKKNGRGAVVAGPRFRLVIELSRPATREERARIGAYLCATIGLEFDGTAFDRGHVQYTWRGNGRTEPADGRPSNAPPLDVDAVLSEKPPLPNTSAGTAPAATGAAPTATGGRLLPPPARTDLGSTLFANVAPEIVDKLQGPGGAIDYAAVALARRGLIQDVKESGAVVIECPFAHEHSERGGAAETVFYPWYVQANKDANEKPFRFGHFKCLHTCHEKHPDRGEWFRAIGLDYDAYKDSCPSINPDTGERVPESANTPESFHGFKGERFETNSAGDVRLVSKSADYGRIVIRGLQVVARLGSDEGSNRGLRLRWIDDQGAVHTAAVPIAQLGGDNAGAQVVPPLTSNGLRLRAPNSVVVDYLRAFPAELLPLNTTRNRVGWFKPRGGAPVFVTPGDVIGNTAGSVVVFAGARSSAAALAEKGTADDWRQNCASWAAYSSRIALALCASFAAPCLELIGLESGGFNIVGPSSKGKSLALRLAASVYGRGGLPGAGTSANYVQSWDTTPAEFEQRLAGHNDLPTIFDEAGQADAKKLGGMLYMLGNGKGRGRAMLDASAPDGLGSRETKQWRTLLLSSSELTVAELLARGGYGREAAAGQETRLADLPACPRGSDFGVFERLPEGWDGRRAAEAIEAASVACYGAVGVDWLHWLVENKDEAELALRGHYDAFRAELAAQYPSTQAGRVLNRLALCAAAGALATEVGLTGWTQTLAADQVLACARSMLGAFKVDREKVRAVAALIRATQSSAQQFAEVMPFNLKRARLGDVRGERLGSRFYARRGGLDPVPRTVVDYPGDLRDVGNETNQAGGAGAEEADEYAELFFFLQPQFNGLVGKQRAPDIARWLQKEGTLLTVGAKPGAALSRIGRKYGELAKTPGYIVNPEALQALAERIEGD